jgi:hypothetical protein
MDTDNNDYITQAEFVKEMVRISVGSLDDKNRVTFNM